MGVFRAGGSEVFAGGRVVVVAPGVRTPLVQAIVMAAWGLKIIHRSCG